MLFEKGQKFCFKKSVFKIVFYLKDYFRNRNICNYICGTFCLEYLYLISRLYLYLDTENIYLYH